MTRLDDARHRARVLWARVRPRRAPESALAHRYLDGLRGIEIGGAAHNAFGLKTLNVDYTRDLDTPFKRYEREQCGEALAVDVVYDGKHLPFEDGSVGFVLSSHVLEHVWDPIAAVQEWLRVVRPGGYVVMIVPHKERTFDRGRPRTTLAELRARHADASPRRTEPDEHCSVWIADDLVELARDRGWDLVEVQDPDDKVGNGFTVVLRKGT
jgi:SAM-dependent methyltransferase